MIEHIEFAYSPELRKDETREANMRNNLNMWLEPLTKEINDQLGIVFVIFTSYEAQEFSIDGISVELKKRVIERTSAFSYPIE